jgi:hypothetical protein
MENSKTNGINVTTDIRIPQLGFIISRHVRDSRTNYYWNLAVQSIRRFYPIAPIMVIDDNSITQYVSKFADYKNVTEVYTGINEKGRGELLPYLYFIKNHFCENAVIIHDSVFIQRHINFYYLISKNVKVIPLWHFNSDKEYIPLRLNISSHLKQGGSLLKDLGIEHNNMVLNNSWYGCFGVQSFINREFLVSLEHKYGISRLKPFIRQRVDRMCLERIIGYLFSKEYTINDGNGIRASLFGNIMTYCKWGYTLKDYFNDVQNKKITLPIIKVWTGR